MGEFLDKYGGVIVGVICIVALIGVTLVCIPLKSLKSVRPISPWSCKPKMAPFYTLTVKT